MNVQMSCRCSCPGTSTKVGESSVVQCYFYIFCKVGYMHGKIWFSKRYRDERITRSACRLRADFRLFSFAMQQMGPRFNSVVSSYRKRVLHVVLYCNPLLNYIGASNFNGCTGTLYTEKALSVWTEKKKNAHRIGVHANTSAQLYFMCCIRLLSWARVAPETNVVVARQIYSAPLNPSAVETGQNRYLRAKMRIQRNNRWKWHSRISLSNE